ncbi:hypothetical protein SCOR_28295 [Sulfidibacter corallicola]|uniref:Uncharacterized protein n=1 Tax=Sulfidibacter corallicola TaxID=2818388 RepID=A0A8A4TN61_SULCO|nr:hypothetical protein [Sulfidibacter corallicola]QTD50542.1 hypothetical protein J3U87_33580 [Sulfidibacter corallicola]
MNTLTALCLLTLSFQTPAFREPTITRPPHTQARVGDLNRVERHLRALIEEERDSFNRTWARTDGKQLDLDQKIAQLEARVSQTRTILLLFLGTSVGGILALWLTIRDGIDKRLNQALDDAIQLDLLPLKRQVELSAIDSKIIQDTKILVLGQEDTGALEDRYLGLGFKQVKARRALDTPPKSKSEVVKHYGEPHFDLVVFDRLDEDWIDAYIELSDKKAFAGHSQQRLVLKHPDRVQFANTPISLLSRILELGRYLHLAKQPNR